MSVLQIAGGFVAGFVVGIGAALFYLRWKMKRQLGNLEEQMGQVMDMTDDLDQEVPEPYGPGESDDEPAEEKEE
ncbi:MAG: hypothetical protein ABEJ66_01390 [Candidatus Nanohaloarchaea archaeon]